MAEPTPIFSRPAPSAALVEPLSSLLGKRKAGTEATRRTTARSANPLGRNKSAGRATSEPPTLAAARTRGYP